MTYYVIHNGDLPRRDNTIFVGTMEQFHDCFGGGKTPYDFAEREGMNVTEQDHIWLTDEKEHLDNG